MGAKLVAALISGLSGVSTTVGFGGGREGECEAGEALFAVKAQSGLATAKMQKNFPIKFRADL